MPWQSLLVDLVSGAGTVVLVLGLAVLITCAGLVYPAVWSRQETRRQAAFELLDLLLRYRWRPDPPGTGGLTTHVRGQGRRRKRRRGAHSQNPPE